jgi:hypothetical protein
MVANMSSPRRNTVKGTQLLRLKLNHTQAILGPFIRPALWNPSISAFLNRLPESIPLFSSSQDAIYSDHRVAFLTHCNFSHSM